MSDVRGRRADDRRWMTDDIGRDQKSESKGHRAWGIEQRSEVRGHRAKGVGPTGRGRMTEDRRRVSEGG